MGHLDVSQGFEVCHVRDMKRFESLPRFLQYHDTLWYQRTDPVVLVETMLYHDMAAQ